MLQISASIVLYKNDLKVLLNLLKSIKATNVHIRLYLIDNSPTPEFKDIINYIENIIYIHNPSNPGFGVAHNTAISKAISMGSEYHFIINPDIYFDNDVITPMINYMQKHEDVGMMMPEVLFSDGSIQFLPKLLPRPFWIIKRKLKMPRKSYDTFINKYELREMPKDRIYNAPILSGCFTLLNLRAIEDVGGYDDKYFMYFEDFDLSRRMHQKYKTIYFPNVSVYHGYASGANKSFKLFKIFIVSAITYFNKWGWFFDKERKAINKKVLTQL